MNNTNEYTKLVQLSYKEAVNYLLRKYGPSWKDYFDETSYNKFLNGEIKQPARNQVSRTSEGLYCHHIDEDKQILISQPSAIFDYQIPYEYQKSNRLVYCDLIEHAILHVLISIESIKNNKAIEKNMLVGIGGYANFLRPNIISWYIYNNEPENNWEKRCKNKIDIDTNDAIKLIKLLDRIIVTQYGISQEYLDRAAEMARF